jgi:hypothetical protein
MNPQQLTHLTRHLRLLSSLRYILTCCFLLSPPCHRSQLVSADAVKERWRCRPYATQANDNQQEQRPCSWVLSPFGPAGSFAEAYVPARGFLPHITAMRDKKKKNFGGWNVEASDIVFILLDRHFTASKIYFTPYWVYFIYAWVVNI